MSGGHPGVTVRIPTALRGFSDGQAEVVVDARVPATVATVLDALRRSCPGIVDRVLDERGRVRRHVNVFIGTDDVRALGGLEAPVPAGAEVTILPAVSGGCGFAAAPSSPLSAPSAPGRSGPGLRG